MVAKRVVVKIGTSSLMDPTTHQVKLRTIDRLAYSLVVLSQSGVQPVLVTSGAIGVGMAQLGLSQRPQAIAEQQALAAIGQSALMRLYSQRFNDYGGHCGQLLLTHDLFDYPSTRQHMLDTVDALCAKQVVPIINENDSVAVDELDHRTTFGDNDQLSALVATAVDAEMLIVLSDIDGLYSADPRTHPQAALVPHVSRIDDELLAVAGGSGSSVGTGGMVTKLRAAAMMLAANKTMVLTNGQDPRTLLQIVEGQAIGTWFTHQPRRKNA